jgi:S1/P1 Nuclease
MRKSNLCGIAAGVALALAAGEALAWGDEGHEAVGLVADHYLTAGARAALTQILSNPSDPPLPSDIASRATWADKYRMSSAARYAATHNWHFVDLEISGPDMNAACFNRFGQAVPGPASQGPPDDCVVDKIEQFEAELSTAGLDPQERQLAVQFLLHFVGDVHQPLHSADNHDAGGNSVYVVFRNRKNPSPLHSFWDDEAVSYTHSQAADYAADIIASLQANPATCQMYAAGADGPHAPEQWAQDAFGLAKSVAYGEMPSSPAGTKSVHEEHGGSKQVQYYALDDTYVADAQRTAKAQIAAAGVRLAVVLNRLLDNAATICS